MANPTDNLRPFKSGENWNGNAGGKPVNARNRVTKKFLEELADDFEEGGKAAIQEARTKDPMGYIRAIVALLPKEFIIERPLEGMTDDELAVAIADLRARLSAVENPGNGAANPPEPEPAGELPTLQ